MVIAVIGRGLIGSAAARHLAGAGHAVVLIGPSEPADKAAHAGVFASHYDEGRITRALDPSEFWSKVSRASIARYPEIEAESGVRFFTETGAMLAGPAGGAFIADTVTVANAAGTGYHRYEGAALDQRFPWFAFPADSAALHERRGAGHLSPRRLVHAQSLAAARKGARCMDAVVTGLSETRNGVVIETDRRSVVVERALVAAGGFTGMVLPQPQPLSVFGRTVARFEVDDGQAERLHGMPSLLYEKPGGQQHYLLPPIRYPDGRVYLKLGGDPVDLPLEDAAAVKRWFTGGGSAEVADLLEAEMRRLMPDLVIRGVVADACVTTFTARDRPLISRMSERLAVATAGCGRGAKCSDELGRLAAAAVLGQADPDLVGVA